MKVSRLHPLETVNIRTKFHSNLTNICRDIIWTRMVDQQMDMTTTLVWQIKKSTKMYFFLQPLTVP